MPSTLRYKYSTFCLTTYHSRQRLKDTPEDVCVYATPPRTIDCLIPSMLLYSLHLSALTETKSSSECIAISTAFSQCYICSIHHRGTCIEQRNRHVESERIQLGSAMHRDIRACDSGTQQSGRILQLKCMTGTNSMPKIHVSGQDDK